MSKYKISDSIALRDIMGESVLVPIKEIEGFNGIYALNSTSRIIYDCIAEGKDSDDAVNAILKEYDADRQDVERDVMECIDDMQRKKIIYKV